MLRCYDVIVIGAGPAGTTTALMLAGSGLSVLLLEKYQLPRDKPCGGGLTPKAQRLLPVPIEDLVLNRAASVQVRYGTGLSTSFRSKRATIWMVRRRELDQRLAEAAARRGVEIHDGESFRSIDLGHEIQIRSTRGYYRGRVAIGADGAESRVANCLRLPRAHRWMVALETEVEVDGDPLAGEAIVDLGVPGGYGWVFPKGSSYNLGVGSFYPKTAMELRWRFDRFTTGLGFHIRDPLFPVGHRIPAGPVRGPLHRGNVLLVGDAAGVADPFFAEGISYSLLTAHLAARVVVDYLAGRSSELSSYTSLAKAALDKEARLWRLTAKVVHRFPALSLRALAASRFLQWEVERAVAGEMSFCQQWSRPA